MADNQTEIKKKNKKRKRANKMNIFWLAVCAAQAAAYHCDKHVVKMVTETTQLLYAALFLVGGDLEILLANYTIKPYKPSHIGHPALCWAIESSANFRKLLDLGLALAAEYTKRYYKVHKCEQHLRVIESFFANNPIFSDVGLTLPPLCMPDFCREPFGFYDLMETGKDQEKSKYFETESRFFSKKRKLDEFLNNQKTLVFRARSWEDAVEAYRRYYMECKYAFAKWDGGKHLTPQGKTQTPNWFVTNWTEEQKEQKQKRDAAWAQFSTVRDRKRAQLKKRGADVLVEVQNEPRFSF